MHKTLNLSPCRNPLKPLFYILLNPNKDIDVKNENTQHSTFMARFGSPFLMFYNLTGPGKALVVSNELKSQF
jgi:hypothetical protein